MSISTAPVFAVGVVGDDGCTQGPSYWCASETNAFECNISDPEVDCQAYCSDLIDSPFCSDVMQGPLPEQSPMMGSDPCTWGPSYWCTSSENAEECGLDDPETECQDYCTHFSPLSMSPFCTPVNPLVGADPCTTWGPSHYCESEENAKECNIEDPGKECLQHCEQNPTWYVNSPFCESVPCTRGPSYWCASEDNAQECGVDEPEFYCNQLCADIPESPCC